MNRRGFLGILGAAAAANLVPEIWQPTKKIFLPPAAGWINSGENRLMTVEEITRETWAILQEALIKVEGLNQRFIAS